MNKALTKGRKVVASAISEDNSSKNQITSNSGFQIPSVLSGLLSLLALSAPVGYIVGYRFQQGYLHAFGLSADSFEISAYESYISAHLYISEGYGSLVIGLLKALEIIFTKYLFILATGALILFLIFSFLFKTRKAKPSGLTSTLMKGAFFKYSHLPKALFGVVIIFYLCAGAIWITLVGYMGWILLSHAPYTSGRELGIEQMQQYRADWCNKTDDNSLTYLTYHVNKSGEVIKSGKLIEQKGTLVALLSFEKVSVFTLKDDEKLEKYYLGQDTWGDVVVNN